MSSVLQYLELIAHTFHRNWLHCPHYSHFSPIFYGAKPHFPSSLSGFLFILSTPVVFVVVFSEIPHVHLTFFSYPDRMNPSPRGAGKSIAIKRIGGWLHLLKGGEHMPITLTVHIGMFTVTITVKSRNRHSAK